MFRKRLRQLRRDFPVSVPVRVYLRPFGSILQDGNRCMGQCRFNHNGSITILVEESSDDSVTIYSLWHEWTHARIGAPRVADHPLEFWAEHGRIVNHYIDGAGSE